MKNGVRRKRGETLAARWVRVLGWRRAIGVTAILTEWVMMKKLEPDQVPTLERIAEISGVSVVTMYRRHADFKAATPEFVSIGEFAAWAMDRGLSIERATREFVTGGLTA